MRASVAELERRLGYREWRRKRRYKLPEADAFLDAHDETVEAFRHRQLHWAITTLREGGHEPAPWQILKRAGLTDDWLDTAASILTASSHEPRSSVA